MCNFVDISNVKSTHYRRFLQTNPHVGSSFDTIVLLFTYVDHTLSCHNERNTFI